MIMYESAKTERQLQRQLQTILAIIAIGGISIIGWVISKIPTDRVLAQVSPTSYTITTSFLFDLDQVRYVYETEVNCRELGSYRVKIPTHGNFCKAFVLSDGSLQDHNEVASIFLENQRARAIADQVQLHEHRH